jgi:hypothetical protein
MDLAHGVRDLTDLGLAMTNTDCEASYKYRETHIKKGKLDLPAFWF